MPPRPRLEGENELLERKLEQARADRAIDSAETTKLAVPKLNCDKGEFWYLRDWLDERAMAVKGAHTFIAGAYGSDCTRFKFFAAADRVAGCGGEGPSVLIRALHDSC